MHQFLKFIFGIELYMFRTVPLSIISSFSLYTQQWYMSYSLRAGSGRSVYWWWTGELSETCRVLFQKWIWEISASGWFYYKNHLWYRWCRSEIRVCHITLFPFFVVIFFSFSFLWALFSSEFYLHIYLVLGFTSFPRVTVMFSLRFHRVK